MRVHTIDLRFCGEPGIISAYLIESGKDLALVETGPGSTLSELLRGIRERGFDPAMIRHVFVTHIHLDHAGAAGWWAQNGATVFVHPKGAPHLVAPEKLIASARRVYGAAFHTLWGEMLPAPAEKIVSLADGETVKVGKAKFIAIDTPGHARHHHAYALEGNCFTGDVAGARLRQSDYLSVTAAPPQFDPVAYQESLARLHDAKFATLFLTHFGEVTDVSRHLTAYARHVEQSADAVKRLLDQGFSGDALREAYAKLEHGLAGKAGVSEDLWRQYEIANSCAMCADGIALYHEKNSSKE